MTAAVNSDYGVNINYSKAFDTVPLPHPRLIEKLKAYGICGKLIMWLKSFLNGRFQRVVLNRVQSHWSEVTSRVPKGSVLGPLLFVMDVAETIQCELGIFADDTKIYSIINSVRDVEEKCDLDSMQEWSRTWLLNLNLEKCKVMQNRKTLNISYCIEILTFHGPL